MRYTASARELAGICADADALITWVLPAAVLDSAPRLRFVSWMHHGVDRLPLASLRDRGVAVANVAGESGAVAGAVAEQALALLLASAKRLIANHAALRDARWPGYWDDASVGVEIGGTTVAIVGFGGLGREVAVRVRAFGARVLAVRRDPSRPAPGADEVFGSDALHEVLARADFVVLCLPVTDETRGLIDGAALASMGPDSFLINVARAELVDEQALFDALTERRIAGFASDVWWDYADTLPSGQHFPVPSRLGVHRLGNVTGAGDQAANTFASRDRMLAGGIENVVEFALGQTPRRLVEVDRGY
jgi:phosphoglycerate dehydrogenase-like enzyme